MKGLFVLFLIVFHALSFNIITDVDSTLSSVDPIVLIISYPIGIIGTWAGFFFLVSGLINAYIIFHQLKSGKNPKQVFWSSIITNLFILMFHYVFVIFFIHSPKGYPDYYSLITGALQNMSPTPFSFGLLYFNSALLIVSLGGILVDSIIISFWNMRVKKGNRDIYYILAFLSAIIMFSSPMLQRVLTPLIDSNISSGKYLSATVISWLVAPRFCMIPFVSFSLCGAMFGLALAREEKWHFIKNMGFWLGSFYLISSIISIFYLGLPEYDAVLYGLNLNLLDLGLMIFVLIWWIKIFEFRQYERRKKLAEKTTTIRRFGMMTLSIYIIDPAIGVLIAQLFNIWFPGMLQNMAFGFLVFIPVLMLFWFIFIRMWENKDFKFSFEWIFASLKTKVRGYSSDKLNWKKNIYSPLTEEPKEPDTKDNK